MTRRQHKPPQRVNPGTQLHRTYLVLQEFPGVPMASREVADETGFERKACSAYLYDLRRMGLITARPLSRCKHEYWFGERVD